MTCFFNKGIKALEKMHHKKLRFARLPRPKLYIEGLALIYLFLLLPIYSYANDEMVMISNPNLDIQALSLRDARNIFSLRAKNWPNGEKISLFVYSDQNTLHRAFLINELGIHPSQLRTAWDRLYYSGMSDLPSSVDNEEEMYKKIVNTAGSLGYVTKQYLDINHPNIQSVQLKSQVK